MSIKIASMNFGDCDTILHNTPNGMKNIAEVLGPNGEVYWSATKELTGIPPLSIRSNGTMLLDYLISGNMSQTGTPTSSDPIQPQECGERTGNLFDKDATNVNNGYIDNGYVRSDGSINTNTDYRASEYIRISQNQQYNLYYGTYLNDPSVCFYDSAKNYISGVAYAWRWNVPFTTPQNAEYLRLSFRVIDASKIILNLGSTPLPYEPYGIKIPISSGGENLLDESASSDADATHINYNKSSPIILTAGQTYTFSCNTVCNGLYIRNVVDNRNLASGNNSSVLTYTPQVDVRAYCRIWNTNGITNLNPMFNLGATALPYVPYVQPTISNIYLGEVQTTRRIDKIDLGTLNWSKTASGNFWANAPISNCRIIGNSTIGNAICTHFTEVSANAVANIPYSFSSCLNTLARPFVNKTGFETMSVTEFKEAMSGVYMYYVLAEPTTGIVNEPLRKIGDYADTVSMEQAGVQIPTLHGNTVIDVETTLKPSQMYIKYK